MSSSGHNPFLGSSQPAGSSGNSGHGRESSDVSNGDFHLSESDSVSNEPPRRRGRVNRVPTPSPILIPTNVIPEISISDKAEDPLPFPPLSPRRSLSIIFEGSESTQSLVASQDDPALPASEEPAKQPEEGLDSLHAPTPRARRLYSLPLLSSLALKLSRSSSSQATSGSVAEKIAFFEGSIQRDKAASTSPRLSSFLPVSLTTLRRHSLPATLGLNSSNNPDPSHSDALAPEELHAGLLWYLNVHGSGPPHWVQCKAVLRQTELQASWQIPNFGRASVTLVPTKCTDINSTATFSHPSTAKDIGSNIWDEQNNKNPDSSDGPYPFHLIFPDGIERFAANSVRDRLTWVAAVWDVLTSQPFSEEDLPPEDGLAAGSVHTITDFAEDISLEAKHSSVAATSPRRSDSHDRTRSTGDMPTSSTSHFRPRLRRIVSLTSLGSSPRSPRTETEYATPREGRSTPSSIPNRRRTISIKSLSSLLTGRSSRTDRPQESIATRDDVSISASTPSRVVSLSLTESQDRHDTTHGSTTHNLVIGSPESRSQTSPQPRMRKQKPRLPRLGRLSLVSYRSFSDGSVPTLSKDSDSSALTSASSLAWLRAGLHSPARQSTESQTLSSMYHTAESGGQADDSSVTNASYVTASESFRGGSTSPTSENSIYVTASKFTSSDAWVTHLNASSPTTSPRRPRHSHSPVVATSPFSSPMRFSRGSSKMLSTPVPSLTSDKGSSIFSIQPTIGSSSHRTDPRAPSMEDTIPTGSGPMDRLVHIDDPTVTTDQTSDGQSHDGIGTLSSPVSSLQLPETLLQSQALASYPEDGISTHQEPEVAIEEPVAMVSIDQEPNVPALDRDLETQPCGSTSGIKPIESDSHRRPLRVRSRQSRHSDGEQPRLKLVPKKPPGIQRTASNASLNSSLFLPSRVTSDDSTVPSSPTASVSLTPVQATLQISDFTSEAEPGVDDAENSCKQRLERLVEFVERTRLAHTNASGEFSEQLSRIERQLVDLGRLIEERIKKPPKSSRRDPSPITSTPTEGVPRVQSPLQPIEVSPPKSPYNATTPTSVNFGASLDQPSGTPKGQITERPPTTEESSSLHLHLFPDVPDGFASSAEEKDESLNSRRSSPVDGNELRGLIDNLTQTLEDLVHRQELHNEALRTLKNHGTAINPDISSIDSKEETIPESSLQVLSRLLDRLKRIPRKTHSNLHLLISSPRSTPNSSSTSSWNDVAEIKNAQLVRLDVVSTPYAHQIRSQRRRSYSHSGIFPSTVDLRLLDEPYQLFARARSLDRDTTPLQDHSLTKHSQARSVASELEEGGSRPLILGDLGNSAHPILPNIDEPITRVWRRKGRVRWATPLISPSPELSMAQIEEAFPIDDVRALLHGVYSQQEAAEAQQQDVVRYLAELHHWLSRDAGERRSELQAIGQRLDTIQHRLMYEQIPGLLFSAIPLGPIHPQPASSFYDPSTIWPHRPESTSTIVSPTPRNGPAVPVKEKQQLRGVGNPPQEEKRESCLPLIVPLDKPLKPEEGDASEVQPPKTSNHLMPDYAQPRTEASTHKRQNGSAPETVKVGTDNNEMQTLTPEIIRAVDEHHATSSRLTIGTVPNAVNPTLYLSHRERVSRHRTPKPLAIVERPSTRENARRRQNSIVAKQPESLMEHQKSPTHQHYQEERDNDRFKVPDIIQADDPYVGAGNTSHSRRSKALDSRGLPTLSRATDIGSLRPSNPSRLTKRGRFDNPPTVEWIEDDRHGSAHIGDSRHPRSTAHSYSTHHEYIISGSDIPVRELQGIRQLSSPRQMKNERSESGFHDANTSNRLQKSQSIPELSTEPRSSRFPSVRMETDEELHTQYPDVHATHVDSAPSPATLPFVSSHGKPSHRPMPREDRHYSDAYSTVQSIPLVAPDGIHSFVEIREPQPHRIFVPSLDLPPIASRMPTIITRNDPVNSTTPTTSQAHALLHIPPPHLSERASPIYLPRTVGPSAESLDRVSTDLQTQYPNTVGHDRPTPHKQTGLGKVKRIPPPIFEENEPSSEPTVAVAVNDRAHHKDVPGRPVVPSKPAIRNDVIRQVEHLYVPLPEDARLTSTGTSPIKIAPHPRIRLPTPSVREPHTKAKGGKPSLVHADKKLPPPMRATFARVHDATTANTRNETPSVLNPIVATGNVIGNDKLRSGDHLSVPVHPRSPSPISGIAQGPRSPNRRPSQSRSRLDSEVAAPETGSLVHPSLTKGISNDVAEIKSILQSLNEDRPGPTIVIENNSYREELAREREKARRLEEEIWRTKEAILAIRAEKVLAQEKKCLDILSSISCIQGDIRHQLQSAITQIGDCKETLRASEGDLKPNISVGADDLDRRKNPIENLIYQLALGHAENRMRRAEQQSADEIRANIENSIRQLRSQNDAQKLLIRELLGQSVQEGRQRQAQLLEAFEKASTERVKLNVHERLDEFSSAMEHEVRTLLREVGNLREQRRNLQHEIGCLLSFRSKMEPGGEFDSSWDPLVGPPCTRLPPSQGLPTFNAVHQQPNIPAFANKQPRGVQEPQTVPLPQSQSRPPRTQQTKSKIPTAVPQPLSTQRPRQGSFPIFPLAPSAKKGTTTAEKATELRPSIRLETPVQSQKSPSHKSHQSQSKSGS